MIKAIIFDFDGVIIDSETSIFNAWSKVYEEYGQELMLEEWIVNIGTSNNNFNAHATLEMKLGISLDHKFLVNKYRAIREKLMDSKELLPGVERIIELSKDLPCPLSIASSSSKEWVIGNLKDLNLYNVFPIIKCKDDVENTKPDPDLYLSVLKELHIDANDAVAIEDSRHGLIAAKNAGLHCIVVPNLLTKDMNFIESDFLVESLDVLDWEYLLHLGV